MDRAEARSDRGLVAPHVKGVEEERSRSATQEIGKKVDNKVLHTGKLHDGGTQTDGRIERTAGDGTDGKRAHHDREADGQAIERVARRSLGGRRVEDHIDQGEREQELTQEPGCWAIGDRVGRGGRRPVAVPLMNSTHSAAATAAANWATQYWMASAQVHLPRRVTPSVTAGL